MDEYRFDRFTMRLAGSRLSRRATVRAGSAGLAATLAAVALRGRSDNVAATSVTAAATPAATPANPNDMEIGGMWFCNQTFALCTTAPCQLSESDPSVANCQCVVENSYSIGFKTCTERAQSGNNLVSNFSAANVNSAFSVLACAEDAPWANCLDVACEIDAYNPALATCQCVMVAQGPSFTFGGACDPSACTATIWSAAPPGYIGLEQYEEGMKRVGQQFTLPASCPAATPVASPVSTA